MNRLRQRLLLLLMVCLPLQGWAAVTMAVSMAGSMALPAQVHHGHQAHDHHEGDHHAHGMMGACCAEPNDAADSAGGTHSPCGDRCHCCVSAAPPSASVVLGVHASPTDWSGTAPSARPQAVAFALDKPPKA